MLSFANVTGSLFNRLGTLGGLIAEAMTYQAAQLQNMTNVVTGVVAQYDSEPDIQAQMGATYIPLLNSPGAAIGAQVQAMAATTINRMVFRDNPRLNQNLTSLTVLTSIAEVIRQMEAQNASILAMTVTGTPNAIVGTGNGVLNVSVRRPSDGRVLENSFQENLLATCIADSYTGGQVAGNELFQINGVGATNGLFNFDWPLGSNGQINTNAIDGTKNNASGNLLTNSDFEDWTGGLPDNYVINVNGGTVSEETTLVYTGSSCMAITGDGSTLTNFQQQFNLSTGTLGTLTPATQYGVNLYLRRDGVAPAAGILAVELVDQNGTVVNDELGTPNSFSINLTGLTTSYASYKGQFRTPIIGPTAYNIRYRLTTALTNGRTIYLDDFSMGQMRQVYTGGPFASVHAGSVSFAAGDQGTITITNSRGAGGTLNTWQTLLYRLFPEVAQNAILFPSSASPTISDSLI